VSIGVNGAAGISDIEGKLARISDEGCETTDFPFVLEKLKKVRGGGAAIAKSPRRPLPRFEFASIRVDSWLRWHSIFNQF
jgi:hypothetical protein